MNSASVLPSLLFCAGLALAGCAVNPQVQEREQRAAQVNMELGLHYMRNNQLEQAKGNLERALGQNPGSAQVHAAYALLQERLREPRLADRHFRRALELDPGNALIKNNYGTFLCRHDRLEEADKAFRSAAEDPLYRTPEVAWTNAGICILKKPDEQQAERYFRRALETNPRHVPALYEMMRLSFDGGRYLQTRAYLQRLTEQVPHTPETLWICYLAETELGNRDASGVCALRLKNDFPDSEQTTRLLETESRGRR
ncbi:type IV pilus biogenesis/stability protein PilW [Ectothiorhodospira shaposhnikovii]|uniref:type IV pilus biogenesis/stability protein PilW n=1 Tax=Ectothiorhodospira shaposhnikovii TaxID=1054 RepID=UPI00190398B2|nr:type IV pilus biogenesis/stability protein PilW [Ectothiorhodospira shaposhnikovii]MBK1673788.1 type IV pilus biogenesis/stability protein PilW [Ectothiorhodospira shaposhnikovii]